MDNQQPPSGFSDPNQTQGNPNPGQNPQNPNAQYPPIVQDFASLANILTQIQYDLFDVTVMLAQKQAPADVDTRIDDQAIQWMSDIVSKISSQLPEHQDPILPIGNSLATRFYQAKIYAQEAVLELDKLKQEMEGSSDAQMDLQIQYISKLQSFLFVAFRWSNLILRERDWFWRPKSEMQNQDNQQSPQGGQQPPLNHQSPQSSNNSNGAAPDPSNSNIPRR